MNRPRWAVVKLGEVLRPHAEWIVLDPDTDYRQVTVKLWGKGAVQRAVVKGSDIAAASQLRIRAGQFIASRIDARHGAFGLVPPELDGAVVSGDFPCFDVDETRLSARYLAWVSRTPKFVALARAGSEGSTNRVRLKEERFLRQTLLLPPLTAQERIVARLDGAAERIARRAETAKAVEAELGAMLQAAFRRITAGAPMARLGDVAPLVRRPILVEPDVVYREIGARSFGRGLFRKPDLRAENLTWQQLFGIEEGDLVFSNIKAWEGAFAVADATHHGCVGSHRYLTCVPNTTQTTPGFLWFYLQSPNGLSQVQAASPGSADRNRTLSTRALADLRIPLPSLDAQQTFDRLHAKAGAAFATQRAATAELDKLIPALLHEAFGAGAAVAMPAAAA